VKKVFYFDVSSPNCLFRLLFHSRAFPSGIFKVATSSGVEPYRVLSLDLASGVACVKPEKFPPGIGKEPHATVSGCVTKEERVQESRVLLRTRPIPGLFEFSNLAPDGLFDLGHLQIRYGDCVRVDELIGFYDPATSSKVVYENVRQPYVICVVTQFVSFTLMEDLVHNVNYLAPKVGCAKFLHSLVHGVIKSFPLMQCGDPNDVAECTMDQNTICITDTNHLGNGMCAAIFAHTADFITTAFTTLMSSCPLRGKPEHREGCMTCSHLHRCSHYNETVCPEMCCGLECVNCEIDAPMVSLMFNCSMCGARSGGSHVAHGKLCLDCFQACESATMIEPSDQSATDATPEEGVCGVDTQTSTKKRKIEPIQ
jgi:hypothetical protein